MPQIEVAVNHCLTPQEVVKRINTDLDEFRLRFANVISEFDILWDGNTAEFTLTALGFSGSGTLEVREADVRVSGELPWKAILFRGRIEELIRERLTWLFFQ